MIAISKQPQYFNKQSFFVLLNVSDAMSLDVADSMHICSAVCECHILQQRM